MDLSQTTPKTAYSSTDIAPEYVSEMIAFVEERGMTEYWDYIADAGLYKVDNGDYAGYVAIPYKKRNGGVWQIRYWTGKPKPKYLDEPGANLHLYNPQHLGPQSSEVWFTEGEMDALCLWMLGIPAIGISGNTKYGTAEFQQAFSLLFKDARRIVCITDNDTAGEVAHQDLIKAFGASLVKRYPLPEGKDVNDLFIESAILLEKELHAWQR